MKKRNTKNTETEVLFETEKTTPPAAKNSTTKAGETVRIDIQVTSSLKKKIQMHCIKNRTTITALLTEITEAYFNRIENRQG